MHSDFLNTIADHGLFHAVMRHSCIGFRDQEALQARIIAGEQIDLSKERFSVLVHYKNQLVETQDDMREFDALPEEQKRAQYDKSIAASKAHDAEFRSGISNRNIQLAAAKELFATWIDAPEALKEFHTQLTAEVEEAASIQIMPMPPEFKAPTFEEWIISTRNNWQATITYCQKKVAEFEAELAQYQVFLDTVRAAMLKFKKES